MAKKSKSRLKRVVRSIFSLINVGILLAVIAYMDARYIEPRLLKVKTQSIIVDEIKLEKPLKIVQFSDSHLGPYYSLELFQKVVDKINSLKPDLIVFTGDLIDNNRTFSEVEKLIEQLQSLKATYGKFAVIGNHDHGGNGTKRYMNIMKCSDFNLLVNTHCTIEINDKQKINLVGIDDRMIGKPDTDRAFNGIFPGAYTIFLSHAPDVLDYIRGRNVNLQLSGHSHGGQIRFPFIGAPVTVPYGSKFVKGYYEVPEENLKIYVNSGLGTSQLPYRFMNLPEITVLLLENK